jgi:dipeptidyl aminopeptidase/acylaminoacyl peptidase
MAITDAVLARPDIDEERTAMMGGSFGGYMANWIAGHTTRFRAIVSHAGLWALDQMFGTTDGPALRMWADLSRREKQVRFLYFPDENDWILKPGDVRVWYETVFAFLGQHVLGAEWQRSELL